MALFLEVKTLLDREFARYDDERAATGQPPLPMKQVAEALQLSEATLSSWRSGQRSPNFENASKLAQFLYPDREGQASAFAAGLAAASRVKTPDTWIERADAEPKLKIARTSYSGAVGFLDSAFRRFIRYGGLVEDDKGAVTFAELKEMIWAESADIGLGLLATIDRSLKLKFLPTPVRYGLNAVALIEPREGGTIRKLRERILGGGHLIGRHITPVVLDSEVGGIYVLRTLEMSDGVIRIPEFTVARYATALIETDNPAGARSVVFADEVTCLEVIGRLSDRQIPCTLLFPLSTPASVSNIELKMMLPEYVLSLCVKRTRLELLEYVVDALQLFLTTDVDYVATDYVALMANLRRIAEHALQGESRDSIEDWLTYSFRLDPNFITSYPDQLLPWRPILWRAYHLAHSAGKIGDERTTSS